MEKSATNTAWELAGALTFILAGLNFGYIYSMWSRGNADDVIFVIAFFLFLLATFVGYKVRQIAR